MKLTILLFPVVPTNFKIFSAPPPTRATSPKLNIDAALSIIVTSILPVVTSPKVRAALANLEISNLPENIVGSITISVASLVSVILTSINPLSAVPIVVIPFFENVKVFPADLLLIIKCPAFPSAPASKLSNNLYPI